MKYRPIHYAEALYTALVSKKEHSQEYNQAIARFTQLVKKNNDIKYLDVILARYESIYLKKQGLKKVEIESVSPISQEVRSNIEKIFGKKVLLLEKINVSLLAGITLLIDNTLYIDASGRTRIKNLFTS